MTLFLFNSKYYSEKQSHNWHKFYKQLGNSCNLSYFFLPLQLI